LPQYVPTLSEMIGPDGQPPTFTGAAWVSRDGRYWWNGTAWQATVKPRRRPNLVLIGIGIVIVAGVALAIRAIPGPTDNTPYGISNAKIDSPTQVEFDYRSKTACKTLTFHYTFFSSTGSTVDDRDDQEQSQVIAGKTYHFTITATDKAIDSRATRFTALPTCHD
jgi:hypothetical protein